MNKTIIAFVCFLAPIQVYAQYGKILTAKSDAKQITYRNSLIINEKLQISNFVLKDENKNSIIDPGENVSFTFLIKNPGTKKAEGIINKLSIINAPDGKQEFISVDTIGVLLPNESMKMSIRLTGLSNLLYSPVKIRIDALEKNGMNAVPLDVEIAIGEKSISKEINIGSIKVGGGDKDSIDRKISPEILPAKENTPDK